MADGDDEAVASISYLFDDPAQLAATARFLSSYRAAGGVDLQQHTMLSLTFVENE